MIDITHAYNEFEKYISNYNPDHPRIALKTGHIKRVAKICKHIAESLILPEEEIKLAELVGIFHDIGRFEQVRRANSFSDKDTGLNHGELGVQVLFEDGLIRNYLSNTKYDNIIKKAVINHNRAAIEPDLSEKELLFAKIVRDADKLDILYTITVDDFLAIFWYDNFECEKINDNIISQFESETLINYSDIHNNADMLVAFYGYIYDLNFKYSLKYLLKTQYMDIYKTRLLEHFTSPVVHKQIEHIHNIYLKYISK